MVIFVEMKIVSIIMVITEEDIINPCQISFKHFDEMIILDSWHWMKLH